MYGIHRIEKRKRNDVYALQQEANRTTKDHLNGRDFPGSSIDWSKTADNIFLIKCNNWNKKITDVLNAYDIKPRKNSVVLLDSIYTASPEFFEGKSKNEIIDYFKACLEFHKSVYGNHVINCVLHFDESNFHCHVHSIPLYPNGNSMCLSARDLMGNRCDYRERQDKFYEQVTSLFGLERGEVKDYGEVRKHITKLEYEAQEATLKAEKAKAELNIRERVNKACSEPMHEIETFKSIQKGKVLVKEKDLEQLQSMVSTSTQLKRGIQELEEYAKQNMEALCTNEKIIKANTEIDDLNQKIREQQQLFVEEKKTLDLAIQEQQKTISNFTNYIQQLEDFLNAIINWLRERRLYKEFENYMEMEKREREHEFNQDQEQEFEL